MEQCFKCHKQSQAEAAANDISAFSMGSIYLEYYITNINNHNYLHIIVQSVVLATKRERGAVLSIILMFPEVNELTAWCSAPYTELLVRDLSIIQPADCDTLDKSSSLISLQTQQISNNGTDCQGQSLLLDRIISLCQCVRCSNTGPHH